MKEARLRDSIFLPGSGVRRWSIISWITYAAENEFDGKEYIKKITVKASNCGPYGNTLNLLSVGTAIIKTYVSYRKMNEK